MYLGPRRYKSRRRRREPARESPEGGIPSSRKSERDLKNNLLSFLISHSVSLRGRGKEREMTVRIMKWKSMRNSIEFTITNLDTLQKVALVYRFL